MADADSSRAGKGAPSSPAATPEQRDFGELRHYVPAEILDVSFPVAVRGYDRGAVDAYVKRVNRAIAELKVGASPPAAVRHALEQAEGKVQGLLEAAREAADEITETARREAEENTARAKAQAAELVINTSAEADRMKAEADALMAGAKREAAETVAQARAEADELISGAKSEAENNLARAQAEADERRQRQEEELATRREQAETRKRELEADTDAVWRERDQLLDDIRVMAGSLTELASAAAGRSRRGQQGDSEEETPEPEAEQEAEQPARDDPSHDEEPQTPSSGQDA